MSQQKSRSIKFGDPRIFFESTTTEPFVGPSGITHDAGAVVRGSAFIDVNNKSVSISLPSMAELIFYQAEKNMLKATSIKKRALQTRETNGSHHFVDEELFYTYMQLCSLGLLGLYASLESMVYELYIRKNKENKVMIDNKELSFKEFTNLGFERKITTVASQLSSKENIYGTELLDKAKEIRDLRTLIQHWDVERRDDYFVNLPNNHPLRVFVKIDPSELSANIRNILDHYSLKT